MKGILWESFPKNYKLGTKNYCIPVMRFKNISAAKIQRLNSEFFWSYLIIKLSTSDKLTCI